MTRKWRKSTNDGYVQYYQDVTRQEKTALGVIRHACSQSLFSRPRVDPADPAAGRALGLGEVVRLGEDLAQAPAFVPPVHFPVPATIEAGKAIVVTDDTTMVACTAQHFGQLTVLGSDRVLVAGGTVDGHV